MAITDMIEIISVKYVELFLIDCIYYAFASPILLRGVAHKIISEALGHASIAFTMDTYSHIIEAMQRSAISLLDEILPEGEDSSLEKLTTI